MVLAGTRDRLWARNGTADVIGLAAWVALAGTSACNLAYGIQQGTSEPFIGTVTLQHIGAALFLAVEIAAAKCIHGAWQCYRAKSWLALFIVGGLGAYCSGLALVNTIGFLGMEKAKVVAALDHDAGGYAHLKAEVERIDKELRWVPEGRTSEQIAADIDLKERSPIYTRTQGCKPEAITLADSRTFCDQYAALDAERKSANARSRLTKELQIARTKLDTAQPVVAADSLAVSVKEFFGLPEEQTVRYKPLAMAVGAWLLAMFGFAASDMVRASSPVQKSPSNLPVMEVVRPPEVPSFQAPVPLEKAPDPKEDAPYLEPEKPLETAIGQAPDSIGRNVTKMLPKPVTAEQGVAEWARQMPEGRHFLHGFKLEYQAYAKRRNLKTVRLHSLASVLEGLGYQKGKEKGGKVYVIFPKSLALHPRVALG